MPNYYLDTEPDRKGNYCLHIENCNCLHNTNQFTLVGYFSKLEEVVAETKSSDYSISLCKQCIDSQFSKSVSASTSIIVKIQNALLKRYASLFRNKK